MNNHNRKLYIIESSRFVQESFYQNQTDVLTAIFQIFVIGNSEAGYLPDVYEISSVKTMFKNNGQRLCNR